ncbi:glycosyl hydrolase family 95 catalytic domain-containing protein [Microbacterium sp. NPDC088619]|uniref:glycosyl hydrolase family 95 catalytic domain-containing protein n=1 Tax=Microbacterium sp. NPDC088619 TaxID=3364196 RepID=UPI003802573E
MNGSRQPWSASTAAVWSDGILAGTGVAGAVLYGAPTRHVIALAHEGFFVPANSRRPAPQLAEVLPSVRDALGAGDDALAADLVEEALRAQEWDPETLIWTDPLGPVAQLEWEPDLDGWSDYRRVVSPVDGGAEVEWKGAGGESAGIRIVAVQGEPGFDVELWAETVQCGRVSLVPVSESGSDASTVLPVDYSDRVRTTSQVTETSLAVHVHAQGQTPEEDAAIGARVHSPRPMRRHSDGGWEVVVGPDGVRFRVDVGEPAASTVAFEDAGALIGRSALSLGGARRDDEPVEDIWSAARAGDAKAERRVFEIAYAAGRRNIIVSTGELPPTLQGVWQGTWAPAWSADYTLNGNVQLGSLASVLWTGTPELMTSLFRLATRFTEHYRSNARNIFGAAGMMLPARTTTHGHANHFLRDYPHQFWVGNGPWLLRLAVDYILVTGDRSVIDEWLWEYAVEILQFSTEVLGAGGGHLNPSYSPENTPLGHDNPLVMDSTADIAAIRDGLAAGAWLAGLRGDTARANAWTQAREQLPPYQVAADGALAEWSTLWPENVAHRHASQLQGLWYEPDERLVGELRDAAARAVRNKVEWRAEDPSGPPGNMEMAFGLTSIALAAVSLGDADTAYQCALWLARDHFTPALTTTHDAGAIFNLDASGALPAVVAAMLLGSGSGRISLLPALPDAWPSGRVTGLLARGGVRVSVLDWDRGGVRATLELPAATRWLRPEGIVVVLPANGRVEAGTNITQLDRRSVFISADAESAELTFRFAESE